MPPLQDRQPLCDLPSDAAQDDSLQAQIESACSSLKQAVEGKDVIPNLLKAYPGVGLGHRNQWLRSFTWKHMCSEKIITIYSFNHREKRITKTLQSRIRINLTLPSIMTCVVPYSLIDLMFTAALLYRAVSPQVQLWFDFVVSFIDLDFKQKKLNTTWYHDCDILYGFISSYIF